MMVFFGHVYNIYLMLILAFMSQFKVYCAICFALCCVLVKQNIIAAIFSCHNNSVLINAAPLFKVVAFNVALFDVSLFDAALFDAELF